MPKSLPKRIINAVAPIRICDIGGWTDTWFAKKGTILNIGVYPYSEVQIKEYASTGQSRIIIHPEDFDSPYSYDPAANTKHPLLESAIRRLGVPKDSDLLISVHSAAPAGASTGTSASVTIALVGALNELNGGHLSPLEIAYEAHRVETEELHLQSGIQDQLAAAFGGVNFIEMRQYPYDNIVTPLALDDAKWWELESRLCLFFLGRRHISSGVHEQVIKHLETNTKDAQLLLEPLRRAAVDAKNSLISGDFIAFGQAATANNEAQRQLHPDLVCPDADKILEVAQKFGAVGGKVNGAGGDGGSVTVISGQDMTQKRLMIQAIKALDPKFSLIDTYISRRGLRVWSNPIDSK